jgi:hypothetical protein
MRYNTMYRKGYAAPSLQPLSTEEEMAKVSRDVLVGIFTTNNCSGKDQIIWG